MAKVSFAMWNCNLLILLLLAGAYLVSSQDDGAQTDAQKKAQCAYWNSVRANYTVCCEYPLFVIWRWQYNICVQQCSGVPAKQVSCCEAKCEFVDQQQVITLTTNDDGSLSTAINVPALAFSFLISVGNDTRWEPVINNAVQWCYDDLVGTADGVIYCGFIPRTFFDIVNCCYNQNYLKCPIWNPYGLMECDYTYQFATNCW